MARRYAYSTHEQEAAGEPLVNRMTKSLDAHLSRAFFEAVADPLLLVDSAGDIVLSNPAAQELFGYRQDQLNGLPVESLIPEHYRDKHRHVFADYMQAPRKRPLGAGRALQALRRDGSEFTVEISLSPLGEGLVMASVRDVTERNRLEETLRKFSRVIEQTASTVVITDPRGVIEYVNPRFTETCGYTAEEAIGQRPSLLKSGHTSGEEYRELWRAITAGKDWFGEFHNRRKDGTLYWESAIISPIRDEQGRVTHFVGIKDDITERKRAEAVLLETQERFRATFEQAAVGMARVGLDGSWLQVNERLCEIVGYRRDELLALTFQEITHPDDLVIGLENQRRMLAGEADTYATEKRYLHKDGNVVWINLTVSLVRKPNNTPDYFIAVVEDISERVEAEKALHESEERLQLLIDHAPAALAMFDHGMRYLAVSRRWRDDYRLGERDLVGRSHYEIFPEIPERWKAIHRRGMAGEVIEADEDRFERLDGSVQWLRWIVRPWYNGSGEVGGVVIFTEDITERKHAEVALRQRDARSQALIETALDGIWMLDRQGRLLAVNDAYARRSGYSREELLTMWIADVEARETPEEVRAHIKKILSEGHDQFESLHRTKAGEIWPVEVSAAYSEAAGNRFFVFIRDISARKRDEAILRESEERYRTTLDNMLEGCQIIDFEWRYRYVNDAGARHGQQTKEALIGRTVMEAYPGIEETPLFAQLKRCMTERVTASMENHFLFPDGGSGWFELSIQPVPEGLFVLSVDITERKRAEAALESMHDELEQVMKYQVASQTVSAIAHELNQPLTALTSYADLALDLLDADNPEPGMLRKAVEGSVLQAGRAGRVVRELLGYLRRGEVQAEPVDINDLVQRMLLKAEFNGSGEFKARLELASDLPPVMANRIQVEKVVDNLILNGVEAMRGAGIDSRRVTVTVRTAVDEGYAQVTVRDSGPGVDADTLHQIFNPFFTTKPRGLGMGLAISRAIIEAHGGQLWVESEPGSGAAFHLTLPFAP